MKDYELKSNRLNILSMLCSSVVLIPHFSSLQIIVLSALVGGVVERVMEGKGHGGARGTQQP